MHKQFYWTFFREYNTHDDDAIYVYLERRECVRERAKKQFNCM